MTRVKVNKTFLVPTGRKGHMTKAQCVLSYEGGRIYFDKSPFSMKDEIKAMKGAKWHGFEEPKRMAWSVSDCQRNRIQMQWMEGLNPFEEFDQPVQEHTYPQFGSPGFGYYDLMPQQVDMANAALTYHYHIWAAEMGTGKTLAAIATMQKSGRKGWWWVGPKSSLYGIRQEFEKWGLEEGTVTRMLTYEGVVSLLRKWKAGDPAPVGVIFDESQRLKTPAAQRTKAAQALSDAIREEHGNDGYTILMTGTPSPKSPADWWAQCEIAWPGFVREGSRKSFEQRLGFFKLTDTIGGQSFMTRVAWKDNCERCAECGLLRDDQESGHAYGSHQFVPSENEIENLFARLAGLVTVVHKKDCLNLPDKVYKVIDCEPTPTVLKVAKALMAKAPNVITGLTHLRELSDGFQYRTKVSDELVACKACNGTGEVVTTTDKVTCTGCEGDGTVQKSVRIAREVPCPKADAVVELLDANHAQKRIVFFAGFTGSIERVCGIAREQGWDTMRIDGRGWQIKQRQADGEYKNVKLDNPMDYWVQNPDRKVAFIAHPKSGGVSLTLCPQGDRPGATTCCFYSNDFDPASRIQAEDRIHRTGMDTVKGALIVDLMHLPTDHRVLEVLRQNRKLELMTMGELEGAL